MWINVDQPIPFYPMATLDERGVNGNKSPTTLNPQRHSPDLRCMLALRVASYWTLTFAH
jgi:hypothetical protein